MTRLRLQNFWYISDYQYNPVWGKVLPVRKKSSHNIAAAFYIVLLFLLYESYGEAGHNDADHRHELDEDVILQIPDNYRD